MTGSHDEFMEENMDTCGGKPFDRRSYTLSLLRPTKTDIDLSGKYHRVLIVQKQTKVRPSLSTYPRSDMSSHMRSHIKSFKRLTTSVHLVFYYYVY